MTAWILVATPHVPFGELLRISLEDSGQYLVRMVISAREARAVMKHAAFQLAIIDSDLTDEPFRTLCQDIHSQQPEMRLIIVPPENNPDHPSIKGLTPDGYLTRPPSNPDLTHTVSQLLGENKPEEQHQQHVDSGQASEDPQEPFLPDWLQEPLLLQEYLKKELAGTQALAAVVGISSGQSGHGTLHAFAGDLEQEAAEELSGVLFRYWDIEEKADLMRFLHLASDKHDYRMYATPITGRFVLALAYEPSASLSLIRPQTKEVAQRLGSLPPNSYPAEEPVHESRKPNQDSEQESETRMFEDDFFDQRLRAGFNPDQVQTDERDEVESENSEEIPLINLSELLGNVPPPDPDGKPTNGAWNKDRTMGSSFTGLQDSYTVWNPEGEETLPEMPLSFADYEEGKEESSASEEPQKPAGQNNVTEDAQPVHSQEPESKAPQGGVSSPEKIESTGQTPSDLDISKQEDNTFPHSLPVDYALPAPQPPQPAMTAPFKEEETTLPPSESSLEMESPDSAEESPSLASHSSATTEQKAQVPEEGTLREKMEPEGSPANETHSLEEAPAKPSLEETVRQQPVRLDEEPPVDPLEDTRPRMIASLHQLNSLDPVSPALGLLNYICVLIPRQPQHYLIGDLGEKLPQWMAQVCTAYGWRLEGIAVRPEYMQWNVQVAPAVSPGHLVRILRERSSQYIVNHFPELAASNPMDDFWAPGYLIVSGPQPPSAQLLREYILQTRKRQGLL